MRAVRTIFLLLRDEILPFDKNPQKMFESFEAALSWQARQKKHHTRLVHSNKAIPNLESCVGKCVVCGFRSNILLKKQFTSKLTATAEIGSE